MTALLILALTLTNSANIMPRTNLPVLRVVRQIGGPVAIVRPPSTNWLVRPMPKVTDLNFYSVMKSTDKGAHWTMIESNCVSPAWPLHSGKWTPGWDGWNTNWDVWDADRLPNVWYRLERQTRFYQFTIP